MVKKFMGYYRPHRKLLLLDICSASIIAIIDLLVPRMSESLIDTILPMKSTQALFVFCMVLSLLYILRAFFQYMVDYWGHVLGVRMEFDMRNQLFAHIQTLPIPFFDNYKVGKLMSRLVNDLNEIAEVAHHGPEDLLVSTILLVGSFMMMFIANWQLALALLVVMPFLFYFGITKNLKFRKTFRTLKHQVANINARSEDNFSGIRVVKAFANEAYEIKEFEKGNQEFNQAKEASYQVMAEFTVTIQTFMNFITLLVFVYGGYLIIQGSLTIGELTAFIFYVQLFRNPINKISAFIMQYNQAMAGYERFEEILAIAPQSSGTMMLPEDFDGEVCFEEVSFQYEPTLPWVIKDLNFTVRAGQSVAIVGHSGGGKSTLCSLIPRFYECSFGRILLDGIDVKQLDLQHLRESIGVVQQDVFIFAGSVKENIAYGKANATTEEIIDAAKKANAYEFIEKLPEGMDTYLGERGVKLSGGQKQRIAIARMFLKNPKLLILDEATSALDNESEVLIQKALDELTKNRTTLVIAHRLSTIVGSDEIIVLEHGKIVERGNHEALLKQQGAYHQLHAAGFNPLDTEEMSVI